MKSRRLRGLRAAPLGVQEPGSGSRHPGSAVAVDVGVSSIPPSPASNVVLTLTLSLSLSLNLSLNLSPEPVPASPGSPRLPLDVPGPLGLNDAVCATGDSCLTATT